MKQPIIFMFSGQGSHYYQMGRELYYQEPVFKRQLQAAEIIFRDLTGLSILDHLYHDQFKKNDSFSRTLFTHSSIFMVEYALASLLLEQGVIPDYVLGVSLGEFCAAVIAGYLTFEEAFQAVIIQAQMLETYCPPGAMMAIIHPHNLYHDSQLIKEQSERAATNFSSHFVISGRTDQLKHIATHLDERGIVFHHLPVSHAFHSALIDDAAQPYLQFLEQLSLKTPRIPFLSCVHPMSSPPLIPNQFWYAIRKPIYFQDIIEALEKESHYTYLDLGPSGTLATFVKYNLKKCSSSRTQSILTPTRYSPFRMATQHFSQILKKVE